MKIIIQQLVLVFILTACLNHDFEPVTQTPVSLTVKPYPTLIPETEVRDGGLITGQTCSAPCFFGVIPGKTVFNDAIFILNKNGLKNCVQDNNEISVTCVDDIFIGFNSSTHVVDGISFSPTSNITLEEINLKYGNPSLVIVLPSGIPEFPKTVLILMYDNLKMRIELPEIDGTEYTINGLIQIELVTYFDDNVYFEMKDSIFSQEWTGYGEYSPSWP